MSLVYYFLGHSVFTDISISADVRMCTGQLTQQVLFLHTLCLEKKDPYD